MSLSSYQDWCRSNDDEEDLESNSTTSYQHSLLSESIGSLQFDKKVRYRNYSSQFTLSEQLLVAVLRREEYQPINKKVIIEVDICTGFLYESDGGFNDYPLQLINLADYDPWILRLVTYHSFIDRNIHKTIRDDCMQPNKLYLVTNKRKHRKSVENVLSNEGLPALQNSRPNLKSTEAQFNPKEFEETNEIDYYRKSFVIKTDDTKRNELLIQTGFPEFEDKPKIKRTEVIIKQKSKIQDIDSIIKETQDSEVIQPITIKSERSTNEEIVDNIKDEIFEQTKYEKQQSIKEPEILFAEDSEPEVEFKTPSKLQEKSNSLSKSMQYFLPDVDNTSKDYEEVTTDEYDESSASDFNSDLLLTPVVQNNQSPMNLDEVDGKKSMDEIDYNISFSNWELISFSDSEKKQLKENMVVQENMVIHITSPILKEKQFEEKYKNKEKYKEKESPSFLRAAGIKRDASPQQFWIGEEEKERYRSFEYKVNPPNQTTSLDVKHGEVKMSPNVTPIVQRKEYELPADKFELQTDQFDEVPTIEEKLRNQNEIYYSETGFDNSLLNGSGSVYEITENENSNSKKNHNSYWSKDQIMVTELVKTPIETGNAKAFDEFFKQRSQSTQIEISTKLPSPSSSSSSSPSYSTTTSKGELPKQEVLTQERPTEPQKTIFQSSSEEEEEREQMKNQEEEPIHERNVFNSPRKEPIKHEEPMVTETPESKRNAFRSSLLSERAKLLSKTLEEKPTVLKHGDSIEDIFDQISHGSIKPRRERSINLRNKSVLEQTRNWNSMPDYMKQTITKSVETQPVDLIDPIINDNVFASTKDDSLPQDSHSDTELSSEPSFIVKYEEEPTEDPSPQPHPPSRSNSATSSASSSTSSSTNQSSSFSIATSEASNMASQNPTSNLKIVTTQQEHISSLPSTLNSLEIDRHEDELALDQHYVQHTPPEIMDTRHRNVELIKTKSSSSEDSSSDTDSTSVSSANKNQTGASLQPGTNQHQQHQESEDESSSSSSSSSLSSSSSSTSSSTSSHKSKKSDQLTTDDSFIQQEQQLQNNDQKPFKRMSLEKSKEFGNLDSINIASEFPNDSKLSSSSPSNASQSSEYTNDSSSSSSDEDQPQEPINNQTNDNLTNNIQPKVQKAPSISSTASTSSSASTASSLIKSTSSNSSKPNVEREEKQTNGSSSTLTRPKVLARPFSQQCETPLKLSSYRSKSLFTCVPARLKSFGGILAFVKNKKNNEAAKENNSITNKAHSISSNSLHKDQLIKHYPTRSLPQLYKEQTPRKADSVTSTDSSSYSFLSSSDESIEPKNLSDIERNEKDLQKQRNNQFKYSKPSKMPSSLSLSNSERHKPKYDNEIERHEKDLKTRSNDRLNSSRKTKTASSSSSGSSSGSNTLNRPKYDNEIERHEKDLQMSSNDRLNLSKKPKAESSSSSRSSSGSNTLNRPKYDNEIERHEKDLQMSSNDRLNLSKKPKVASSSSSRSSSGSNTLNRPKYDNEIERYEKDLEKNKSGTLTRSKKRSVSSSSTSSTSSSSSFESSLSKHSRHSNERLTRNSETNNHSHELELPNDANPLTNGVRSNKSETSLSISSSESLSESSSTKSLEKTPIKQIISTEDIREDQSSRSKQMSYQKSKGSQRSKSIEREEKFMSQERKRQSYSDLRTDLDDDSTQGDVSLSMSKDSFIIIDRKDIEFKAPSLPTSVTPETNLDVTKARKSSSLSSAASSSKSVSTASSSITVGHQSVSSNGSKHLYKKSTNNRRATLPVPISEREEKLTKSQSSHTMDRVHNRSSDSLNKRLQEMQSNSRSVDNFIERKYHEFTEHWSSTATSRNDIVVTIEDKAVQSTDYLITNSNGNIKHSSKTKSSSRSLGPFTNRPRPVPSYLSPVNAWYASQPSDHSSSSSSSSSSGDSDTDFSLQEEYEADILARTDNNSINNTLKRRSLPLKHAKSNNSFDQQMEYLPSAKATNNFHKPTPPSSLTSDGSYLDQELLRDTAPRPAHASLARQETMSSATSTSSSQLTPTNNIQQPIYVNLPATNKRVPSTASLSSESSEFSTTSASSTSSLANNSNSQIQHKTPAMVSPKPPNTPVKQNQRYSAPPARNYKIINKRKI